jgi:hypothetical protein
MTLLTASLELGGIWRGSGPVDAAAVIERMRVACLADVSLVSDHQPEGLRVDDQSDGNPSIWLHTDNPTTVWIIVTVGNCDWCRLSYQFRHELGHVLCNSWQPDAKPRNPCQWIEEALVEAFSLRGLRRLADGWSTAPLFANDVAFADAIRSYLDGILAGYRTAAHDQGMAAGTSAWFTTHQPFLSEHGDVDSARGAITTMLALLEDDASMIADMGALNRWPGRSGVSVRDYLSLWQESCAELGAPGRLPEDLSDLFARDA